MEGFAFSPPESYLINDGFRNVSSPAEPTYVAVGYEKSAALKAFAALTPTLTDDRVEQFADVFSVKEKSRILAEMVVKANKQLGSIQITSLAAIYSTDEIAIIRVTAKEGQKERVVYQAEETATKSLLTKVKLDYFDKLIEAVLSRF